MLELLLLVCVVVAVGKTADYEDRSTVIWGGLALALGIGSLFVVPLPFGRILIAAMAAFGLMMVAKATGH